MIEITPAHALFVAGGLGLLAFVWRGLYLITKRGHSPNPQLDRERMRAITEEIIKQKGKE